MEVQYYTPKLEEFHVGFDYEAYIPEKEVWSKETFYMNQSHINLVQYVDMQNENTLKRVRVKHLDEEDIQSLGWKLQKKEGCVRYFEQKNRLLWYNLVSKKMIVIVKDPAKSEVYLLNDIHKYVHNITIKNISQFKKLMNQINFFNNE